MAPKMSQTYLAIKKKKKEIAAIYSLHGKNATMEHKIYLTNIKFLP